MSTDARFQRRIQRYGWDKAAAYYERYWGRQLEPAQDLLVEMASIQPGERILEVACGTGLVTFRAASAVGESGGVVATDLSQAMVDSLRENAERRGVANISAERMDAEALRFSDATFDVVLCALGLMYVPDAQLAVREMLRVLAPGGRCVAAVWGARNRCGWAEIFPIVESRVQSEVCPLFFQLGNENSLSLALSTAGFTDVTEERISTTLHYESAQDACGAAFAGGPVALAYSRFDEQTREAAHADYLESIEPYRRGAQYDIPGEFVVARGLKVTDR